MFINCTIVEFNYNTDHLKKNIEFKSVVFFIYLFNVNKQCKNVNYLLNMLSKNIIYYYIGLNMYWLV